MPRLVVLALVVLAAGLLWAPFPTPPRPTEPADKLPDGRPDRAAAKPPVRPSRVAALSPGCLARFGDARLRCPGPVGSVALTPDGKLLAVTARNEPVIRIWDVATAQLVRELRTDAEFTVSLTLVGFAPDGRRLVAVRHQWRQNASASQPWHEPAVIDASTGAVSRWAWGVLDDHYLPTFTISPDGKTVAGVTCYGEVGVWDLDTGREVRKLGKLEGSIIRPLSGACYSPDGASVAACGDDPAVYVAPLDGSRPLRRILVEGGRGVCSVFWPRPDRLVALWSDGLAALDPTTGRELARVTLSGNIVSNPRASVGDALFAKEDTDKDLVAIDLSTLEKVSGRVFDGGGRDAPFAASADGRVLALSDGNAVRLFDAATRTSFHPDLDRYPADPADRLHLSADGRRLLTAGGRSAHTWDLPAGRLLATPRNSVHSFSAPRWMLSPDGRRVAGGYTPDGRLVTRDAGTGAEVSRESDEGDGWLRSVVAFADDDRLWVRELRLGRLTVTDLSGRPAGPAVPEIPGTSTAVASPDGLRLAVGGWTTLAVRDADPAAGWHVLAHHPDRHPVCGFDRPSDLLPVAFSPDGRRLLALDGGYAVWNVVGQPALVGRLPAGGPWPGWHQATGFSPDGRRLVGIGHEGNGGTYVCIWETASAAELVRFAPPGGVSGCAITPDGKRLVVAHPDTTFSAWDCPAIEARADGSGTAAGDAWVRLASPDPRVGQAAVRQLVADPREAIRLLTVGFTPAVPANVTALIADLDSPRFPDREAASKALAEIADTAETALREAAETSASAEVRQRAEAILRRLTPSAGHVSPAYLRAVRAVEVLERIGTAETRAVLAGWAADARLTVRGPEAAAAVTRLGK